MSLVLAKSQEAQSALSLVKELQALLVTKLNGQPPPTTTSRFKSISWLREQGNFGGGTRWESTDRAIFNNASVNVSQVQYEKDPAKRLNSATALSAIVHPSSPFSPSIHLHISWTEIKSGDGYWRLMADLNPSIPDLADRDAFNQALAEAAGEVFHEGKEQGELYFYIPALGRRRGVAHFYLEEYRGINPDKDGAFAHRFGAKMIQCYGEILARSLSRGKPTPADERQQLEYHTLYFLQVLLLDRGTTSGLLVHQDNDLGILGSLPCWIDRELLTSWIPKHPALQQELMNRINNVLEAGQRVLIDAPLKLKIAQIVREFYGQHPEAQDLLAKGKVVPPTVSNHR